MRKDKYGRIINNVIGYTLAATMIIGLVACDSGAAASEDTTGIAEATEDAEAEPDTVATIIEVADVIEDENGNILDAVSHEKLSDAEIEKKMSEGIINRDKNGKLTINQEKNVRKAAITIDAKTNEIITAEAADGKTYIIDDGNITAPKNQGKVKVDVKTSDKKKAEVTVSTTEVGTDTHTSTERKSVEITTEEIVKVTTEEAKTESKNSAKEVAKKTEELTEKATEKKTENNTQQKAENNTQSRTEQKTEARTQATTQATTQARTEQKTEARTQATTQATTQTTTQARTEATTQTKTEPTTQKNTEAPTEQKTEAPKCAHNWVWKTHTEYVHKSEQYLVTPAWDEAVYETHNICNNCGTDLDVTYGGAGTDAAGAHLNNCGTGYHTQSVQVGTVHHDAVYDIDEWDEEVEVKDYQYCSKCGERK